jgi:hypothetical protein
VVVYNTYYHGFVAGSIPAVTPRYCTNKINALWSTNLYINILSNAKVLSALLQNVSGYLNNYSGDRMKAISKAYPLLG